MKNFKQNKALLNTSLEEMKSYYYQIDFALRRLQAYDMDEAKVYLKQIIFHGQVSDTEMAIYYADTNGEYEYYLDLEEDFELYPYIDHAAVKEEVKEYGDANIRAFIDYEALGRDMFEQDILIDAYYRFEENVFEITDEDIREYIDGDIAEYFYLSIKKLIDNGYEINIAAEVAKGELLGEAA